jgi:hypothetical protein
MTSTYMTDNYSYCETIAAYVWHIRRLTTLGRKLSGGADTLALCKARVAWDLKAPINDNLRGDGMCRECTEKYEEIK